MENDRDRHEPRHGRLDGLVHPGHHPGNVGRPYVEAESAGRGRTVKTIVRLLIRGPEAPYVLSDLDDAFDRDIADPAGALRISPVEVLRGE